VHFGNLLQFACTRRIIGVTRWGAVLDSAPWRSAPGPHSDALGTLGAGTAVFTSCVFFVAVEAT
jgi:hypothetical protein